MYKKRFIGTVLAASVAAASAAIVIPAACTASAAEVTVTYDGEVLDFDVDPIITDDGHTMVPMRTIFERFGAYVKWDGDTQTITAKKGSKTITLTIDSNKAYLNGEEVTLDTAPTITDGRTLVPLRAISELLGLDVDWDGEKRQASVTTSDSDEDDEWKENEGTIDLGTMTVSGDGASVSDNTVSITSGGDFKVTGTCTDGMIYINTEDKVRLRLSGASLTNADGPAIYSENCDKLYITLADGTENTLSDGADYSETANGVIYSKDDMVIKGDGSLTVNGSHKHGIACSDSIEISGGDIDITAATDGIHANDTILINGGTLDITATGDGIQSEDILSVEDDAKVSITTNGEVESSQDEMMPGGMPDMNNMPDMNGMNGAAPDASAAPTAAPTATPTAMPAADEASSSSGSSGSSGTSSKGLKAEWLLNISGGEITLNTTDHAVHCADEIDIKGGELEITSENKGISGHGDVIISDGSIDIKKSTEGIESKSILTISGGDISVIASDDGFNAGGDSDTFADMGGGMPGGGMGGGMQPGGDMQQPADGDTTDGTADGTVPEMPNGGGMQPGGDMQPPTDGDTTDGTTDGTAPEMPGGGMGGGRGGRGGGMQPGGDMQQQADGTADGTAPEMPDGGDMQPGGMGNSDSSEISTEHHIEITGGNIYISSSGDGIDSNASLRITGGTVTVDGPTSGGDAALDTDGAMLLDGGTVIAIGAAGMLEIPSSASGQNVIVCSMTSQDADSEITVVDSDGKTIAKHAAAKQYESVIFSSDALVTGGTYSICVNGEEIESVTIDSTVTSVGSAQSADMGGGMQPGGGMGGGMGGGGMQPGMGGGQAPQDAQAPQNEQTAQN